MKRRTLVTLPTAEAAQGTTEQNSLMIESLEEEEENDLTGRVPLEPSPLHRDKPADTRAGAGSWSHLPEKILGRSERAESGSTASWQATVLYRKSGVQRLPELLSMHSW